MTKEPTMITDWLNEHGDPEITKKVEKEAEILILLSEIKEAAERLYPINIVVDYDTNEDIRNIWIEGAKWQSERMYNEEDMKNAYKKVVGEELNEYELKLIQWFEQFKKK